jgi:hypothetical protein
VVCLGTVPPITVINPQMYIKKNNNNSDDNNEVPGTTDSGVVSKGMF